MALAGTPNQAYCHPKTREAAMLIGEYNFLPGEAQGGYADCLRGDWLEYYGQYQRIGVTLAGGIHLVRQADAGEMVDVGQDINRSVNQPFQPIP